MKEYEMTDEELQEILNASTPEPMVFGGQEPPSPQENANRAWRRLGEKRGFDYNTVIPSNKGKKFFRAEETVSGDWSDE